jgi:hypothetical protein
MRNFLAIPFSFCNVYSPGFVRVNGDFKKRYDPNPSIRLILKSLKYKNRPSKVGFLSSLAQNVISCGPDGERNREA